MRSQAKASSAGPIEGNAGHLAVAGFILLLLSLVLASPAQASNGFAPSGSLGDGTASAGLARVAVEESSGHVLVVDSTAGKVDVFDSSGSGAALLTSFGEGELSGPYGIAIDQANGDVYVTDPGNARIVRYESDGAPTPTYTLDAGYNSPAASPTPEAGAPDGTIGSFASAIAVAPTNADLLVADRGDNRVSRFNPAGAFVSDFDGSDSPDGVFTHLEDIVLSPAGLIFVADATAPDAANGGSSRVLRFAGAGAYEATLRPPAPGGDAYLAYDAAHTDLIVGDARGTFFGATRFAILDPATGAAIRAVTVAAEQLTGLAVDPASKRLYAPVTDPFCAGGCGPVQVQVFDSQTHPDLVLNAPSAVTDTSVHLSGSINPDGVATTYRFELSKDGGASWKPTPEADAGEGSAAVAVEADVAVEPNSQYLARLVASNAAVGEATAPQPFTTAISAPAAVTGEAAEPTDTGAVLRGAVNPFGLASTYHFEYGTTTAYGARVPAAHEAPAGNGAAALSVSQGLAGLAPGTTYHYRLLATNSVGTTPGLDRTFTTAAAAAPARGYEQVTLVDKEGGTVDPLVGFQAEANGNGFVFKTVNVFGGSVSEGAPRLARYISFRHPDGWTGAMQLDPPTSVPANGGSFFTTLAVSRDFTKALVVSNRKLAEGGVDAPGAANLYLRDTHTGAYTFVAASEDPTAFGHFANIVRDSLFVEGAPDFSWIRFFSAVPLRPGDAGSGFYRWSAAGGLQLDPGAGRLSEDGSKLYYTPSDGEPGLFLRQGSVTTPISVSQVEGGPTAPQGAVLKGISKDGRYAVFYTTDGTPLTSDAPSEPGGLYRYDASTGSLTYLQVGSGPSVLAVSEDARIIYFSNSSGIWVSHEGVVSTVTSVAPQEIIASIVASPNGRYLAFNQGVYDVEFPERFAADVYLYDAVTGERSCASCPPDGGHSSKESRLRDGEASISNRLPQVVTDGGEVFFDTETAVVGADTNGTRDVYSYGHGRATLISPGNAPFEARLGDISEDGSNVFFVTSQSLVRQDDDRAADVYDARVGGGIPEQNEVGSAPCSGESCQGEGGSAPNPPSVASIGSAGTANARRGSRGKGIVARASATGSHATLKVTTPEKGRLVVTGAGLERTVKAAPGSGTVTIAVGLTPRAAARLQRQQRFSTKATVTFHRAGGGVSTTAIPLAFKTQAPAKGRSGR